MARVWYRTIGVEGGHPQEGHAWIGYDPKVKRSYVTYTYINGAWVLHKHRYPFGGPLIHQAVMTGVERGVYEFSEHDPISATVWVEVGEVRGGKTLV